VLSPRSRGKGSRRFPGRDGGRRKQKVVEWRKRAAHAVDALPPSAEGSVDLTYRCPFGRSAAESIYLFDQRIAHTGIRYRAELHGPRLHPVFIIRVPVTSSAAVGAIIIQIEKL
jgi:hypothetical protein